MATCKKFSSVYTTRSFKLMFVTLKLVKKSSILVSENYLENHFKSVDLTSTPDVEVWLIGKFSKH